MISICFLIFPSGKLRPTGPFYFVYGALPNIEVYISDFAMSTLSVNFICTRNSVLVKF